MKLIFQTNPYEFEKLIAELLEEWGWESVVTSRTNDKGIDILVSKSVPFPQEYAIQVKQNSEGNKIGSPKIQQYNSIRDQRENVDGVIVITTSSYTSQANDVSDDLGVELLDGDDLIKLFSHSNGQEVLNQFFDIDSEQSTKHNPQEGVTKDNSSESEVSPNNQHLEHQVFDAICKRYGRGLSGPTELDTISCPECSGNFYRGKIMHMRESRNIKFCTDCETVFIEKENGWKAKPIYL